MRVHFRKLFDNEEEKRTLSKEAGGNTQTNMIDSNRVDFQVNHIINTTTEDFNLFIFQYKQPKKR